MALSNLLPYLLTGQFWAANFLALIATLIYSMASTGATEGNLKWQLPMTNWKYWLRFIIVFIVFSTVTNAALAGVITTIAAL